MATGLEQTREIIARYEREQREAEGSPCGCLPQGVCALCYYEKLGELIEKHPIVSPKRR